MHIDIASNFPQMIGDAVSQTLSDFRGPIALALGLSLFFSILFMIFGVFTKDEDLIRGATALGDEEETFRDSIGRDFERY